MNLLILISVKLKWRMFSSYSLTTPNLKSILFLDFSGFFDRREFIVTQHPLERTICDFWRMVWEQESRLIVTLSSIDSQECRPFWPAIIGEMLSWETNKRGDQMRLTLQEEADTLARRAIRLNLELVRTYPTVALIYFTSLILSLC